MSDQRSEVSAGANQRKKTLLGFCVAALALAFTGWNSGSWPAQFRCPGELYDVEGMRLVGMLHLRQGAAICAPKSAIRTTP